MSLLFLIAATATSVPAIQSSASQNNAGKTIAQKTSAQRSKARVSLVVSATIIRQEKVSPLREVSAPTTEVERPIAQQRIVKSGVPYVEFY